jgi:thiol-disulfide isomerase/thioredoxin
MKKLCFSFLLVTALLIKLQAYPALEIGMKAPDFKLKKLLGNSKVSLSAYKGKVVLVDFWASWCAPCKISMPHLQKLSQKYKNFTVIAVNIDDEKENAIKFLKELNLEINAVHDSAKEVIEAYNVPEMPTAYLVDQYGKIQYIHSGYSEEKLNKLEFAIRSLVD